MKKRTTKHFVPKRLFVVGGGTAGWLTALLVQKFYPQHIIYVVESEEIGILGAGEGTVPPFLSVLDLINVGVNDIVRECDGTIKVGINFMDWAGEGSSYMNEFSPITPLGWKSFDRFPYVNQILYSQIMEDKKTNQISFPRKLAVHRKVPFIYGTGQAINNYALHFNARKLAKYLRSVAERRDIKRIEGKVTDIVSDETGIKKIIVNGVEERADFVFDCTGFARVFIGNHFNIPWKSYRKYLPLDRALPFFIHQKDMNPEPETKAIAMKYGWAWHIPVQERFGCGYVYDSSYIDEEQAKQEVISKFGEVEFGKTFVFEPGSLEKALHKNCLAVGLAHTFVEPLEATSIWNTSTSIIEFLMNDGIENLHGEFEEFYNKSCDRRNQEIVEFLYLHYMSKREDTEFWKNFKTKNPPPERIEKILKMAEKMVLPENVFQDSLFVPEAYLQVMHGLGLLDVLKYKKYIHRVHDNVDLLRRARDNMIAQQRNALIDCMSHQEFIENCKK